MTAHRTDAEKKAFAMKCLEIERQGGDVLGYIRDNYPSYTPRAAWINLQKQYLHRGHAGEAPVTDGRITNNAQRRMKNEERRTMNDKEGSEDMRAERKDMQKACNELLHAVNEGRDPRQALLDYGFRDPRQALVNIKRWAKSKAPDLLPELEVIKLIAESREPQAEESETVAEEAQPDEQTDLEELPEEYRLPQAYGPLEICAVRATVMEDGVFSISSKTMSEVFGDWMYFKWFELDTKEERCMGMDPADWRTFAAEILQALNQLGL